MTVQANVRIFCGCFPTGWVWADRQVEVDHDYKRLAYMSYAHLKLELEKDCPNELAEEIRKDAHALQERRGERYVISGCGQYVTLGAGKD